MVEELQIDVNVLDVALRAVAPNAVDRQRTKKALRHE
jgi:hypothetical protein